MTIKRMFREGLLELGATFAMGLGLLLALPIATAQASDTSGRHYGRQEALRSQDVSWGQVVMVRHVTIDNRSKVNAGTAIGGAVGYGAARQVNNKDAKTAARVAGTVIGGVAGGAINNALTKRDGVEVFVRTNKRGKEQVISVVQDADTAFATGDVVLLVGSGRDMRVVSTREVQ
ncbi:hypothetical protein [Pseudoxanthomonas winnipegensis]|uniref:outer membrane lipoprotein n=1 Tax=Pseudoxanthomonas winnipegensis TaxID=2480810 RepID=UPI0010390CAC|nr:hypothetical protein [Pseudoxanthomonas winnipegensis]TBV69368.1 hypothetical protein EYC45_19590 [Pseudoxanthomonas winnipegensis]